MRNRTNSTTLLLATIFTCFTLVLFSQSAHTQDCPTLADLRIEDTNILSATVVPASGELPEYCRVLGYVRPAINFEIRLPTSGWNNKFYMAGCWGFCGTLEPAPDFILAMNQGLQRNYAVSTMDTGHWGESLFDGRWAYHNRQAEIDFAYRAVHETARVTKELIDIFYDQKPEYSYFGGCSGGGRQANMEAWRYPDDFDGIISGCPWLDTTGNTILSAWLARANSGSGGKNLITVSDLQFIKSAVYRACDPLDGLEDGLISEPTACQFDPATLACEGNNSNNCLSETQVEALNSIYENPKDSSGRQLYPGIEFGSEPDWIPWITGEMDIVNDDLHRVANTQFLRYMALREDPGSQYSLEDFDFARDQKRMEFMANIYDASNPDLDDFHESGGKLLMWHGWADASISPMRSIEYYNAVEERIGSRNETQNFLRLFLIPGMTHCGLAEGPGILNNGFDPLTALEQWVEQGEAPTSMITTKTDSTGTVQWTRPVCPYPQHAVYDGEGDVNDASNFECVNP